MSRERGEVGNRVPKRGADNNNTYVPCRDNKLTLDKKDVPDPTESSQDNPASSNATGNATAPTAAQNDDGAPAILQLLKNQAKVTQSFYIASMQPKEKGRGVGSTLGGVTLGAPSSSSTVLGLGGGRGLSCGGGRRASKPKWMVSEVSRFTMTGSELVQERNVISASMGISHVALLTGMLRYSDAAHALVQTSEGNENM